MVSNNLYVNYMHLRQAGLSAQKALFVARTWHPSLMNPKIRQEQDYNTMALQLAYAYLWQDVDVATRRLKYDDNVQTLRDVWYECYRAARMA